MKYNFTSILIKKYFLIIIALMTSLMSYSQNALRSGDGWGSGWSTNDYFSATGFGNAYGKDYSNTAGAGNRYFRLYTDFSGNQQEHGPSGTNDIEVTVGTPINLESWNSTNGKAYYINVANTTDKFVFRTPNGDGVTNTPKLVVFRIQGSIGSVASVSQLPAAPLACSNVVVTANTTTNLPTGQGAYLRYSTDNFSTSSIIEMSNSGTGTYTATIPSQAVSTTVKYYVFTSGSGLTISPTDTDWFTINGNTNGGSNYSYTVSSSCTVQNISTSTYYPTIQSAIDAASAGNTIEVGAGTYNENVNVNKSIILKGANFGTSGCDSRITESIVAGGAGAAFTIAANDVTIDGFKITGLTGITSSGFAGNKFKNNLINTNYVGINLANVTFMGPMFTDIIQGNCINLVSQVISSTTATIGIVLNGIVAITMPIVISNNTISGAFYGYLIHKFNAGSFGMIMNSTITGTMQGIAVVNTLDNTNYFPSSVTIRDVSMSGFTGNYPSLPAQNFTAGIYTFTGGATTTSTGITLNISKVTIDGTTAISPSGAGIYLGDFSTGSTSVQTINVSESTFSNNLNRGFDARGRVTATINTSTFTNNGSAAFGTGGNDGYAIIAQRGATVTVNNCFITHPATSTTSVTALMTGNTPASTITASNNSILMNGNTNAKGANNTSGGNTITATCNWWGVTGTNVAPLLVGSVAYETFLTSGTDSQTGTAGFQPAANSCNGCSNGNSVTNTTSGLSFCSIQAAINDATTNNGDVIVVGAGTYVEDIVVSKSLDIRGPNYGAAGNSGSRVAEAIIVPATNAVTSGEIIHVAASGVSINGFTIDGDNPSLTGGANNTINVDMNAAEGVTVYENNINNLTVSNNIFKNLSYFGVSLYGANSSAPATTGNTISNNKFQDLGTYTESSNQVNFWGGGILLYNNHYAAVNNNVMSNVRLGIQTGNFSQANTGSTVFQAISNNTMQVRRVGVFHNLHYSATSPYTISNNSITGLANANETGVRGLLLGSLSVNSTVSGNNIDLSGITTTSTGIEVWNVKNTTPTAISGGSISNVNTGIFVNNYDGYNSNATDGASASISNISIAPNASGTGIRVFDNPASTHVAVNATIGAGVSINNGTDGIVIENTAAEVTSPLGNVAFTGQTGNYIKLINNAKNLDAKTATFETKTGNAMTSAERTAAEGKLLHKPDNSALGLVTYFDPVHNITKNTFHATIQDAVTAADANDVIQLAEWTFNEKVVIDKSITIQGTTKENTIITGTGLSGYGSGITINNGITNVTIKDLTVKNFVGNAPNSYAGIYAIGGNNNLTIKNTIIQDNVGGSGIYANGPVNTVLIDGNKVSGHTNVAGAARGIVIWNGLKENITITNNEVFNNNCCGIELQDGTGTNVSITNNNIHDNADNGLGIVGLTGPGTNTVSLNTITNNGRFGIEVKNPNGSGVASGAGSVLIDNNNVTRSVSIGAELRDIAGIAVFRRGVLAGNVDIPQGVVVQNNTVSGYTQPSSSDGFGIVVEGMNHKVLNNTVSGNDVGIQRQAGHTPYPGDGDASNLADSYFGRGNSPVSCGITISGNTLSNTLDTRDVGNSSSTGIVTNTTTNKIFCTLQAAISDAQTLNGHTLEVASGTYDEQVLVSKSVNIKGVGTTKPIFNFTGTASGKPTIFDISADGVTVDNINFKVDMSKLRSAIIASAANIDVINIKNNLIEPYGTPAGSYGDRNAVSINYGGTTNYRVATGGVNSVSFTNNTVTFSAPSSAFRSGISLDEGAGIFTNNTLQTINHDILIRFVSSGNVSISNNHFNGGGVELAEYNAGAGITSVTNNTFDATFGNVSAPGTAVFRLKNNEQNKQFNISGNTFTNHEWGVSIENFRNVTFNNNNFTPLANSTTYKHIVINTKVLSSSSSTTTQTTIGATLINNTFNGSGTLGGTALSFLNHDNDNASFGAFNIGTTGNENTFNTGIAKFIVLDTQTGSTNGSTFPTYPTSGNWPTTMACWSTNIDIKNNFFDVGSGAIYPSIMTFAERTLLENKLDHKLDASCAGLLEYYLPVQNVTQNTFFATIQPAIAAANANDVIELSEWTFPENITIDKPLTLQGVDSTNVILDGSTLGNANGITLANGIQNITIKKIKIRNFKGSLSLGSGIFGTQNSNLMIDAIVLDNNQGRGGIFLSGGGGINNVTIKNSISKNHAVGGSRGIVIWDGFKQNITIQNNKVYNNNCCGIELQDGTASGVTITDNLVVGNFDNGFGLTGLKGGIGANIIENNIIRNNGRFGIEIKNPNGSGLESGDGSIVVKNNTVSLSASASMNNRDHAGIAVFRRGFLVNNSEGYANIPTGVVVSNNNVSGYKQLNPTSTESKGYGIVIEGTNHKVLNNTVDNTDVGIQEQGGAHTVPNYVDSNSGDGEQADGQSPNYFGRGNTPIACSNTIDGNTLTNNTINSNSVTGAGSFAMVKNTTTGETFCSIQAAINDPQTLNGHTLEVSSGSFNEQVLVNKEVIIKGIGSPKPIINFTGTPALASGKLTAFEVIVPNVTVENLEFKVDISKIGSAIVASVALPGSVSNLTVKNNIITPYRSSTTTITFGARNAVNINYGAFRVNTSNPTGIIAENNTINYSNGVDNTVNTTDDAGFRSGFAMDEGTGNFTGNTIQTISQDIEVRFTNSPNNINITNNSINGGGVNYAAPNTTGGTLNISGNTFNGAFSNTYSSSLRIRDNIAPNTINTVVENNTFINHSWAISLENYRNITVNNNTFTPLANSTTYHHITVNTKENASSSATVSQTTIDGIFTNNTFNGSGTTGGTAIKFLNHDVNNASFGTFTIGSPSNENTFNAGIATFIALDNQTGSSSSSTFPLYPSTPTDWITTMAPWAIDLDAVNNKFDVGTGLKLARSLTASERTTLESALFHKYDDSSLGRICIPPLSASISAVNPEICLGDAGTLKLNISGPLGPFKVTFSDGSTTTTVNNYANGDNISVNLSTATTYTLTALEDYVGCAVATGGSNTSISINALPVPTIGSNTPLCAGSTLNLNSGGGVSSSWVGPNSFTSTDTSPSISNVSTAASGIYTVTVTNAKGCTATATTEVTINPVPNPILSSNSPQCVGSTLTLGATDGTNYAWTGPNSFVSSDASPNISNVTIAASGIYTVTVTNSFGCTSTATVAVTINPLPVISVGSNSPQCVGKILNLTASGGATYAWSGPDSFVSTDASPSISNVTTAASGIYTVTVTTALGCSTTATTEVVINPLPAKPVIIPSSSTICLGGSVTLVAICPNMTLTWSNGANGSAITVSPTITTNYTVTCTNSLGCTSVNSDPSVVNVVAPPAKPVITPSLSTICSGNSTTLTASACDGGNGTLNWTDGRTGTSISVSPTSDRAYKVSCTSVFGCTSDSSDAALITLVIPPSNPIISNTLISSGTSATLTAICASGTPVWYSSLTSTSSLGVGSFITPNLISNTQYFVACETVPGSNNTSNPQNCTSQRITQGVSIDVFSIVKQAEDIYVCSGQNASFSINASGASISYQWQENSGAGWSDIVNGGIYSGATTSNLNLSSPPTSMDGYQYRCIINNTLPNAAVPLSFTSNPVYLVVKASALANNLIMVSPLIGINNLYQAVQTITATNQIESNSKINYFAGNSISLNPGFEVKAGSVFQAKIQVPCINTSKSLPDTLKK